MQVRSVLVVGPVTELSAGTSACFLLQCKCCEGIRRSRSYLLTGGPLLTVLPTADLKLQVQGHPIPEATKRNSANLDDTLYKSTARFRQHLHAYYDIGQMCLWQLL